MVRAAIVLAWMFFPRANPGRIVERMIPLDDERRELILDYRRAHEDPAAASVDITPRMVVLHYTGGHSAEGTMKYFAGARVEKDREKLAAAGALNVGAHFVVDRDGTIYQLFPDTQFTRHCVGLNHLAIGVENVGDGEDYPLTREQVAADAALIRHLAARHALTHVIGHHESPCFEGHAYFVERDQDYRNEKPDPGAAFLRDVRARIADLGLAGAP